VGGEYDAKCCHAHQLMPLGSGFHEAGGFILGSDV
jgi:hypothetical protein